jgi:hypothetical protein
MSSQLLSLPRVLCLLLALALAACGGGGGSSSTPQAVPVLPGPTAQATGVSPATALAGDAVTLSGSGFTTVNALRLAGQAVPFTRLSDTQLRFTVPAGATTGSLTLAGAGYSVATGVTLNVAGTPLVRSLSASAMAPGASFTITGANLDAVSSFTLVASGSGTRTLLAVSTQSPGSVTLLAPSIETQGTLLLRAVSGTEIDTLQTLRVGTPPRITAFSPASALLGAEVTLLGAGLGTVSTVQFGSSAPVAVTPGASDSLRVVIPGDATSGPIRVSSPLGTATSASALTVLPTVRVASFAATIDAAGVAEVSIGGQGLDLVNGVTVGATSATLVTQTATSLRARVAAPAEGAVVLAASGQPAVTAGTVVRGAGSKFTLSRVQLAQQFAWDASDSQMRLAANRPTLLRVQFTAATAGVPVPAVKVTGSLGATALGEIALVPPSGLSSVPLAESSYDLSRSWWAELPAAWVQPGVRLQLSSTSGGTVTTAGAPLAPTVGTAPRLNLVLVPLRFGGHTGVLPADAEVLEAVARAYPHVRGNLGIERRAALDASDITLDSSGWSTALGRLNTLRNSETGGAKKVYLGFVPSAARTTSTSGLAYVNSLSSATAGTAWMSALSYDASFTTSPTDPLGVDAKAWQSTLIHEIGHLMGRSHAPCGGPSSPDAAYPYPGGRFGPRAVWDAVSRRYAEARVPPALTEMTPDVMGYCGGTLFSDYNLKAVQSFAEAWSVATVGAIEVPVTAAYDAGAATAEPDTMVLSGMVTAAGAVLFPASLAAQAVPAQDGPYEVRLTTVDGRVFSRRFALTLLADHLPERTGQFQVGVPALEDVTSIEVFFEGNRVHELASGKQAQRVAAGPSEAGAGRMNYSEAAGVLTVSWVGGAHAHLSVAYLSPAGERRMLLLGRSGGEAQIDTSALPAGGRFELLLSSERALRRVVVGR